MSENRFCDFSHTLPFAVQERVLALYLNTDGLTRAKLHTVAGQLGLTVPPDLDLSRYFSGRDGSAQVIMQPDALMKLVDDLQRLAVLQSGSIVNDSFQAMQSSSSSSVSVAKGAGHQPVSDASVLENTNDDDVLDRAEFSTAVEKMFNDSELAERAADTFFANGPDRADLTTFKRLLNEEPWRGVAISSLLATYAFEQCGALDDLTGCGLTLTLRQVKATAFACRLCTMCATRLAGDMEQLVTPETGDITLLAFKRHVESELTAVAASASAPSLAPLGILGLLSVVAPEVILSSLGSSAVQTLRARALSQEHQRSQSFLLRAKLAAGGIDEDPNDGGPEMTPEEIAAILEKGTQPRKRKPPTVFPRFMNVPQDDELTSRVKARVAGRRVQADARRSQCSSTRSIGFMVQVAAGKSGGSTLLSGFNGLSSPRKDERPQLSARPPLPHPQPPRPFTGGARPRPPSLAAAAGIQQNSPGVVEATLSKLFCINDNKPTSGPQGPRRSARPLSASARDLYSLPSVNRM